MYLEGKLLAEIAAHFKIGERSVSYWITKLGIQYNSPRDQKKK